MKERVGFPTYHRVLEFFAGYLPTARPLSTEVEALLDSLRSLLPSDEAPRWAAFLQAQGRIVEAAREAPTVSLALNLKVAEVMVLGYLALHLREGQPMLRVPWVVAERLSAAEIQENLKGTHLRGSGIPDTLWIEWSDRASSARFPWVRRTAALLVTRLPLFDLPPEILARELRSQGKIPTSTDDDALRAELLRMAADGRPMLGYHIVEVCEDERGMIFYPHYVGQETSASLREFLVLHNDVTVRDRPKRGEASALWVNLAIRFLLLVGVFGWFREAPRHDLPEAVLVEYTRATPIFYVPRQGKMGGISLRARAGPLQLFRIET